VKVRVSKRGQSQIERAAQWWDEHRDLAPQAFDEDIAKALLPLRTEPLIGAPFRPEMCMGCATFISPGFAICSTTAFGVVRLRLLRSGIRVEVQGRLSNRLP